MLEKISSDNVRQHIVKATSRAVVDLLNEYDPEELAPVIDEASAELGRRMAERTADNLAPFLRPVLDEAKEYRAMIEQLLRSAHPNPRDHPTMTRAWAAAEALLERTR